MVLSRRNVYPPEASRLKNPYSHGEENFYEPC